MVVVDRVAAPSSTLMTFLEVVGRLEFFEPQKVARGLAPFAPQAKLSEDLGEMRSHRVRHSTTAARALDSICCS
jgi:hypothetical protein